MMTICLTVVRTTKLLSMHLHQINQKNVKRMTWKACQRVFLESVSEGLSESVSHRVSESVSDRKSESVRDRALKSIRDRVSNSVAAETVVGSGSEGLSERLSNNVSDSVSQAVGGGWARTVLLLVLKRYKHFCERGFGEAAGKPPQQTPPTGIEKFVD